MKASEIRELTVKEIEERLENEKSFLSKQKINHAISPLDNPLKIQHTRKSIARLKTILKQKAAEEAAKK